MRFRNVILGVSLIASLVNGEDSRIWSAPAYGKVDPREYLPESLYTNCVAWYCMNQNPAQFATWGVPDGSSTRNNGRQTTANRRPSFSTTNGIGCMYFDGVDDFITLTDGGVINPPFTISAWAKYQGGSSGGDVISRYHLTGDQRSYIMRMLSDATVNFYWYTNGANIQVITATGATTNTFHLVSVVSTSSNCIIYVDGAVKTTGVSANPYDSSNAWFSIGSTRGTDGAPSTPFKGIIDAVKIANVAQSATEITNEFIRLKGLYGL